MRTIGTQCYEDDDLAFAQQQELERQFQNQNQSNTFVPMHPDLHNEDEDMPTRPDVIPESFHNQSYSPDVSLFSRIVVARY